MSIGVLILPGINCPYPDMWHWYQGLKERIEQKGHKCILEPLPDPKWARSEFVLSWIKQKVQELKVDRVIGVGHCMGALSLLQYLQTESLYGGLLVAPCLTSIPFQKEEMKDAKYWELVAETAQQSTNAQPSLDAKAIQANCSRLIQLSCSHDQVIPYQTQLNIAKHLGLDPVLHEIAGDKNHFMGASALNVVWKSLSALTSFDTLLSDIMDRILTALDIGLSRLTLAAELKDKTKDEASYVDGIPQYVIDDIDRIAPHFKEYINRFGYLKMSSCLEGLQLNEAVYYSPIRYKGYQVIFGHAKKDRSLGWILVTKP